MPRVDVGDGVELYYEDFDAGPPVVFVHGGAATHDLWEHQVHRLTDEFRTIVYDLRGVGESDKPRDGYTVQQLADDLAALVRALDLEDVTFVSHGLGGHVLLRFVDTYPALASRLVLTAAAPWYLGDLDGEGGFSEEFFAGLNARLARNNPAGNWDLFENWLFHRDPGEPMKLACLQMALAWPLYVWKALATDLPRMDHRSYLAGVRQPTLVLHGLHDRKNRYRGAQHLADAIPNATLVTFRESAHCPFFEEMEQYNETLVRFISGQPI